MDEDETDYGTPIGKVIKHINTLCKKPQIDDQLSEALDLFIEKLDDQEKYLVNGIFKVNFSEAALFLQSSAELYGRKIDLLWDQLLEFHTRLIKYDCEHQKKKGAALDKEVIEKLEERRNRYKRKKKFKLLLQTSETQQISDYLIDKEEVVTAATAEDDDSDDEVSMWKELESKSAEMRKIPNIVYKQMTQMYRLKNYHILKCQDFEIWDPEDDEFNTKYSRVPGWHHTLHLFEYNDKGLLPDKNNIIAKLRLTAYGRIRFLISRKIPLNTPFEQYKDEYMAYRKKFFEEEAKKWQNMPLDTLEDLRKQLQYLVQKEREENGELITDDDNAKLGRYGVKTISTESMGDKIEILDSTDEESLFELTFSCDKNFMNSDLFVRLEKLSSDLINTKLRQDSGFYDFNSDSDNDCDNENIVAVEGSLEVNNEIGQSVAMDVNSDGINASIENGSNAVNSDEANKDTENAEVSDETNKDAENVTIPVTENSSSNPENAEETSDLSNKDAENGSVPVTENSSPNPENAEETSDLSNKDTENISVPVTENSSPNPENAEETSDLSNKDTENVSLPVSENSSSNTVEDANEDSGDVDNFDTQSFISDHDYCGTVPPNLEQEKTCTMLPSDNGNKNKRFTNETPKVLNITLNETTNKIVLGPPRIIPKIIRIIQKKDKPKLSNAEGDSPPKRRKLSVKQVEKLLQSKIKPVREGKFEKFFSMNYQPQLGEGEISAVEYESGESDEELDNEPQLEQNQPDDNQPDDNQRDDNQPDGNQPDDNQLDDNHSVHSRQDDTRSAFSDHDYCQRTIEESYNDSGFIDTSDIEAFVTNEQNQDTLENKSTTGKDGLQTSTESDLPISIEDEYEKLLAALKESKKGQEKANNTSNPPTEQELKEKERKEAHARVEEWRSTITPILRRLQEHDFDIHDYGSRIMENMEINETKPFTNIVQGESSAEVVRYFISSLQLANTCNIEICGAQQGQLSNDTFGVKLLTKDRYHEHLDDFLAPSEETFREKLERVRAMAANEQQVNSEEPSPKKLKLRLASKGHRVSIKDKLSVRSRKIQSASVNSLRDTELAVPSTSTAGYSETCVAQNSPNMTYIDQVQDENTGSPRTYQAKPLAKGKSIIKRSVMSEKSPNTNQLDRDISTPSTSYYVATSTYLECSKSVVDEQLPSTSYQRLSPPPKSDYTQSYSPNIPASISETSPDKRRRESDEDIFRERLAEVQGNNPDIQLQSTPHGPPPFKKMMTSSFSKKSMLFQ